MKRTLSIFLAAALVATALFCSGKIPFVMKAEDVNLITNGGFEDSNKGWTWVDTKESSSKYVTEEKGYESTHSMRLKDGEGGGKGDYCYQEFSVEKNTDYIVSFKAYFEKLDTKKQTQWGIISGSGNTFDTNVTLFVETLQDTTGNTSFDWVTKAHSFNSGDNDKLRLVFRTYTGTLGYVDNVSVVKVEETDNLVKDGGFEYGKLYWGTDWNNINSISDKWVGNYFKTGEGRTESSATVEKGNNKYIFTEFECTPDTDYEVSFWSKSAGGINCTVLPTFDATKQTKVNDDYVNQNGLGWTYSNDSAVWKENTLIFNSGNHSKLSVVFYNRWGGNTDNRFDDISVKARPSDPEKNLIIKNHSFEYGTRNWVWLNDDTNEPISVSDAQSYDGDHSAKFENGSYNKIYQDFTLEKNTDYVISFKSMASKLSWAAKWGIRNTSGSGIDDSAVVHGGFKQSGEWISNLVKFNSGDNENLRLVFQTHSGTLCYIDDIYIIKSDGIVLNSSFENDKVAWNLPADVFDLSSAEHYGDGEYSLHAENGYYNKASQAVALDKNTTYKLSFYYKGTFEDSVPNWGISHTTDTFKESNLIAKGTLEDSEDWKEFSTVFSSGEYDSLSVMFQTAGNCNFYIDAVKIQKTDETPSAYTEGVTPTFLNDHRGARYVCDDDKNLISGADFENSGNWDTPSFIGKNGLGVVDSDNAVSGNKLLKFAAEGDVLLRSVFYVDVEPNTDYSFSAWVCGDLRSVNNKTDMTFGIIDANTGMFMPKTGNAARCFDGTISMIPPSWDGNWHLIGMDFNSGTATKVGVSVWGTCSTAIFDDMYLCKKSDAVEYVASERRKADPQLLITQADKLDCDTDKNVIGNFNLSDMLSDYWQTGRIFGNTVTIKNTEGTKGNSLYYNCNTKNPSRVYYIKWIDVEKNTDYTFSCDYNILEAGEFTFFGLITGNKYLPSNIMTWNLDESTFDVNYRWKSASAVFNTKDYDRIGFVVFDGGGSAYLDNLRLFKTADGKELSETDNFPKSITNMKYNRNGEVMTGIPLGTTLETLKETIAEKQYIKFFKDGKEITDLSKMVATGIEVRLMDGPEIKDRFTLIINGDVNGDGLVDKSDIKAILNHLTHITELNGVYKSASDVDKDGNITINDATLISADLNGKYTIKQ